MGQGCVDWPRCFRTLRALGFDGPLTVHTEYDFDESVIRQVGYAETTPPNLEEWAKEDAAYLRALLSDTPCPNPLPQSLPHNLRASGPSPITGAYVILVATAPKR